MCDPLEVVEFENGGAEFGSLCPFHCSSPGSRSWFAYAFTEIMIEHPIHCDFSSSSHLEIVYPHVSSPEFDEYCPTLDSQGLFIEVLLHAPDCLQLFSLLRILVCRIVPDRRMFSALGCLHHLRLLELTKSNKQSGLSPSPDYKVVRSSSNGRSMLPDSLQTFKRSANASHENREVIVDNQHTRKKSNTKWSAGGSISLQDIEQNYGKKRAEAAEALQVSVSTFKRLCRKHGIPWWPSTKRKRDASFLSARKSIASFQVADGEYASASQSQKAFLSALQPFSASSTVIETHQASSLFSIQSNHSQGDQLHNHNMLGNIKTTKRKNMPQGRASTNRSRQCKATNGSLSIENLMPDSLEKTSRPPQNCIPCDEDSGTSSKSSHKRKRLEKETDCIEKVTHFEEQPSQTQNCVSKRQAVDSASKDSSFLSSISGTIEGNNMGYIPNSITCMELDAKSPPEESTLHNRQSGEECALLDPFLEQPIIEHRNLKRKGDTGPSGQDHTIFELGNKQKVDKKLKKTWGIGGSISLDNLKQHFGKKREEAAESLRVSISTLKRICRENGISRWPTKKIMRDRLLLSNLSINETVSVAGGGQISISTTPTAFASTKFLVKSNQQKSWMSNLSLDNEIGTSITHDVLRNDEGTDGENIMILEGDSANQEVLEKPQEFEPAHDSLIPAYPLPDAPTILSPLPQETVTAKDSPGQQLEEIARQIEMADGTCHLEKQYLGRERLCRNTEKEVIVSVEESSSYDFRNVSLPNQDHLADFASLCEVNKDQLISMDDLESNCIKSQSTLESKSESSLQNDARRMKLIFEKLITLPLEDLTNPNHEASLKEALTILAGNLSLFTDEQAKRLLEFKFDFPTITYSWRDCSQSRIYCRNFLAEFEKTKSLLETSTKDGEDLKDRYTQIECKEKEMMAQLEAIQKEKNEISKRKSENFKQTKHLAALAEEKSVKTKEKELQMTIASAKLDKLKSQWVSVQSSFN